ncbi:serine/arginine repetitive matrix protein 2-like [Anopheles darlingi]|uniref:serine/arginine repetitive matrix protein 2-like n=1 Tax=Anopheles darlingi TaxID=43151 RepID=UPI0021006001|nr:serine/arginine repetitive matrix protein 2-like [Anopheles darlingi]
MERARVYLCGLVLGCLIATVRAQLNESFATTIEPVIDVYDADPSKNVLPFGGGDTVEPGMEPGDNSTLLEPTTTDNHTASGTNTTDYEQPLEQTTPKIDDNYVEYFNNLEKMLNKSDPAGDFNYHYPDSYDYNFNLSIPTPKNNSNDGFFNVTPEVPGPTFLGLIPPGMPNLQPRLPPGQSLFGALPPAGLTDLQRAYSPPGGGIVTTRLQTNLSASSASSTASDRIWPAETSSYSGSRDGIRLRTGFNPIDLGPVTKPTTTATTTSRASTMRSTSKTRTKSFKSAATRSSRKPKLTTSTTTKRSKQFRSVDESPATSTTTTTQPPRRSLKKPTAGVLRDRRHLGSRNRTTPNTIRRRRTRTGKRFRRLGRPTPTARRNRNPLPRPRQRQRPWAMPPLMMDYEFWMF